MLCVGDGFTLITLSLVETSANDQLCRVMNARQLRSASARTFWLGTTLLVVGGPLLVLGFASGLNLHNKNPREGELFVIIGGISLLASLLCSALSIIWGTHLRVRHGEICTWPILAVLEWLFAIAGVIGYIFARVHGWL